MLPGEERAAQPPAPANILPQEDSRLPEAQLRREARSPEESPSSRKGCPRRSRRAYDVATSAEPSFDGGQPAIAHSAPANIRPQEENDYRNPNSGESPVRRRKALAPVRVILAGAGEQPTLPPPTSPRSSEDSIRIRAQLRQAFSHRRTIITGNRNSGEKDTHRKTLVTTNR